MPTIDEIMIYGDEDGFHLVIHGDAGQREDWRIGLPDQFRAEVDRTIGRWLAEGEDARTTGARVVNEYANDLRLLADADAYDKSDPRHPMWHDTMSGLHDNREGK